MTSGPTARERFEEIKHLVDVHSQDKNFFQSRIELPPVMWQYIDAMIATEKELLSLVEAAVAFGTKRVKDESQNMGWEFAEKFTWNIINDVYEINQRMAEGEGK